MKRNRLLTCAECTTAQQDKYLCTEDGNVYKGTHRCNHGKQRQPKQCITCRWWIQEDNILSQFGACDIKGGKRFPYCHECWDGE